MQTLRPLFFPERSIDMSDAVSCSNLSLNLKSEVCCNRNHVHEIHAPSKATKATANGDNNFVGRGSVPSGVAAQDTQVAAATESNRPTFLTVGSMEDFVSALMSL